MNSYRSERGTRKGIVMGEIGDTFQETYNHSRGRSRRSFRSLIRGGVDRLLDKLGFEIMRKRSETEQWMETWKFRNTLIDRIGRRMADSVALLGNGPSSYTENVRDWVAEYFDIIPMCPVRQFVGGGGWNAGLQLFCLTRALEPVTIIESGTFKGFSSWVFWKARPQAKIHCFDIDFGQLVWRGPAIAYHQHDWFQDRSVFEKDDFNNRARVFAYFDDHVSQARRIQQARHLGLLNIAFDDNLPTDALFMDGTPAVPTVDMIFDERLRHGDIVEWYVEGKPRRYEHHGPTAAEARQMIKSVVKLPHIEFYRPCSTTVVQLHPHPYKGM